MKKCMCCFNETEVYVVRSDSNNEDLILCNDCEKLFFNEFGMETLDIDLLEPDEIKNKLDEKVIGQNYAKKILSFEIYRHLLRIKNSSSKVLNKSNIMLIGPSGSGKTLIIKTLSEIVKLPFVEVDITAYTQTGYVGLNVTDIISNLLKQANGNVKLAEYGIVFIDEVDKISKRVSSNDSKDVSGEGVQQNLLKILEGTVISIQSDSEETIDIDTKNILFIGGGAFSGIESFIEKRVIKKSFGFISDQVNDKEIINDNLRRHVKLEDIINYGILTEFIGRFPVIVSLNSLKREELYEIAITELQREIINYFSLVGKKIIIKDDSIDNLIDKCINHTLGARAIKANIHDMFKDTLYEITTKLENEIEI